MRYNYKILKAELIEKKLADGGFVAWGQTIGNSALWGGSTGSAIAGAQNQMYTISMIADKIAIIPFLSTVILYEKAYAFQKDKIKKAKVGGFGVFSKIKITTVDGKLYVYNISQGRKDIKKVLEKLGLTGK